MKTQLKKKEEVILVIRKHWFSLIFPIMISLVVTSLVIVVNGIEIIGFLILIPVVIYLIYMVLYRNSDVWIVTTLRVIDEYGVFTVNSKETPLDKINNVSYHKSFLGRIFGFGNVVIQSAAESGATTHILIEKPELLKDTITEYQELYKEKYWRMQTQGLTDFSQLNIVEEIEKLYALKERGIINEKEFELGKSKILNN